MVTIVWPPTTEAVAHMLPIPCHSTLLSGNASLLLESQVQLMTDVGAFGWTTPPLTFRHRSTPEPMSARKRWTVVSRNHKSLIWAKQGYAMIGVPMVVNPPLMLAHIPPNPTSAPFDFLPYALCTPMMSPGEIVPS